MTVAGHQMYSRGTVVGKALLIDIEISRYEACYARAYKFSTSVISFWLDDPSFLSGTDILVINEHLYFGD